MMKLKDCVFHLQIKFTKLHRLCFCSSKEFPRVHAQAELLAKLPGVTMRLIVRRLNFFFQLPGGYYCIFNWQYVGSSSHF